MIVEAGKRVLYMVPRRFDQGALSGTLKRETPYAGRTLGERVGCAFL